MDEDQKWLEALAGRAGAAADPVVREAQLLRAHIGAQAGADDSTSVAAVDAAREAALIERARAEGVLPPRVPRRRVRAPRHLALAAASVAALALAIGLWRFTAPPAVLVRGVSQGVVRIEARDPLALQEDLVRELNVAGARASRYERLGRFGIDADLPRPLSPRLRQVLEQRHIPVPPDGELVIEIAPAGAR